MKSLITAGLFGLLGIASFASSAEVLERAFWVTKDDGTRFACVQSGQYDEANRSLPLTCTRVKVTVECIGNARTAVLECPAELFDDFYPRTR